MYFLLKSITAKYVTDSLQKLFLKLKLYSLLHKKFQSTIYKFE